MSESIIAASSESDYAAFASLIREYVEWGRARYADEAWFVEAVFGHQGLDDELNKLQTEYGAPNGKTLLAVRDGEIYACGAYRYHAEGICEMKRLYVPKRFQGTGTGRKLCKALMAAARLEGFHRMRLDTANRMSEARAMYHSLGFEECAPFHDYPIEFRPYVIFLEATLDGG
jgi:GNAT superfamily N-acetyltransferase